MEETKLMSNVEKVLNDFLNELVTTYKQILINNGKVASGNLVNSIQPNRIEQIGDEINATISAAEYAKYVEDGRKPGKFPPPPAIQSWVEIKFPQENSIKQNQIAFLIGRKIARFGIPPGNYLDEAVNQVFPKYNMLLNNAIEKDLQLK